MEAFTRETGLGWLGNYAASGTVIIQELGDEHVATGKPIVYTSADSVFQIAAHEDVIPIERALRDLRDRADARPGRRARGGSRSSRGRSSAPMPTASTRARTAGATSRSSRPSPPCSTGSPRRGRPSYGIGKIGEIFAWRGICESPHSTDNMDGFDHLVERVAGDDARIRLRQPRRLRHGLGAPQRRRGLRARARGGRRAHARAARRDDRRRPAHHHRRPRLRPDHALDRPQPRVHAADRAREGRRPRCGPRDTRATFADIGETVLDFYGLAGRVRARARRSSRRCAAHERGRASRSSSSASATVTSTRRPRSTRIVARLHRRRDARLPDVGLADGGAPARARPPRRPSR